MDAEWCRLDLPDELGGSALPPALRWAVAEMMLGANPARLHVRLRPGVRRDRRTARHRRAEASPSSWSSGGWGATMVLTEPDAGSDVGAGRTKAIQQDDGSWHIEGVKRFITSAEHDMTENIIHLVLARPEGAGPGTKGLSLFIVPKFRFDRDRRARRAQRRLRHQRREEDGPEGVRHLRDDLRRRASPARAGCVGDVHDGIRQMFHVIEYARMVVGTKAMATLSTGYLNALAYAKERVQGADLRRSRDKAAPRVTITHHPDVRRC